MALLSSPALAQDSCFLLALCEGCEGAGFQLGSGGKVGLGWAVIALGDEPVGALGRPASHFCRSHNHEQRPSTPAPSLRSRGYE
jgi:hypothetical protein